MHRLERPSCGMINRGSSSTCNVGAGLVPAFRHPRMPYLKFTALGSSQYGGLPLPSDPVCPVFLSLLYETQALRFCARVFDSFVVIGK